MQKKSHSAAAYLELALEVGAGLALSHHNRWGYGGVPEIGILRKGIRV